jgi:flagellar export protein FliJ
MKRFQFSLESVLTLRKFRKSERAAELSRAMRQRLEIERNIKQCRSGLESLENSLRETFSNRVHVHELLLLQEALRGKREDLTALESGFAESLDRENAAREAVKKAQQECEALHKLEERQRERSRREAEHEDEKAMEEFVTARRAVMRG